jgi:hypothetical protein
MCLPTLTGTATFLYYILAVIYKDDYDVILPMTIGYIILIAIFIAIGLSKYSTPKQR